GLPPTGWPVSERRCTDDDLWISQTLADSNQFSRRAWSASWSQRLGASRALLSCYQPVTRTGQRPLGLDNPGGPGLLFLRRIVARRAAGAAGERDHRGKYRGGARVVPQAFPVGIRASEGQA